MQLTGNVTCEDFLSAYKIAEQCLKENIPEGLQQIFEHLPEKIHSPDYFNLHTMLAESLDRAIVSNNFRLIDYIAKAVDHKFGSECFSRFNLDKIWMAAIKRFSVSAPKFPCLKTLIQHGCDPNKYTFKLDGFNEITLLSRLLMFCHGEEELLYDINLLRLHGGSCRPTTPLYQRYVTTIFKVLIDDGTLEPDVDIAHFEKILAGVSLPAPYDQGCIKKMSRVKASFSMISQQQEIFKLATQRLLGKTKIDLLLTGNRDEGTILFHLPCDVIREIVKQSLKVEAYS
jgi:hypothetical protein